MMRKYLLATDGSRDARLAAYFLLDLVRSSAVEFAITLLHVVNVKKEIYNYPLLTEIPEIEREIKEQTGRLLDEVATIFTDNGFEVNKVVLEGDPGREIAEYARLHKVNQIVMGSRGLGNIKGMVLGSVSQKVIYLATAPVTLVKQPVD